MGTFSSSTVLITGANSGLGFDAAGQLAESGYGRVILACRSQAKADAARAALVSRVGSDPFETLVVDVASVESARAAALELIERGNPIDSLVLNAGVVPGDVLSTTDAGLEMAFAASIIGHHVLTLALLEGDMLARGAGVVIAGSEGANGDLPAMFDMKLYDFVEGGAGEFGDNLRDAMFSFIRGSRPELYVATRYYATAKVFTAWWSAAMARHHGDRISVYTVSPGASMNTSAARHQVGFKKFLFTKVMPLIGPMVGLDQPIAVGAKRYIDVLHGEGGSYRNGAFYASPPGKVTGKIEERTHAHLLDREHQDMAWQVIAELAGTSNVAVQAAAS